MNLSNKRGFLRKKRNISPSTNEGNSIPIKFLLNRDGYLSEDKKYKDE